MTLLMPGWIEATLALTLGLAGVWALALVLLQRIRVQEGLTRERVTQHALDQLGQLLMTKMDEKFDEMEAAQGKREGERMAYLRDECD